MNRLAKASWVLVCLLASADGIVEKTEFCKVGGVCGELISNTSISYFMNNTGCGSYGNYTNFKVDVRRLDIMTIMVRY